MANNKCCKAYNITTTKKGNTEASLKYKERKRLTEIRREVIFCTSQSSLSHCPLPNHSVSNEVEEKEDEHTF